MVCIDCNYQWKEEQDKYPCCHWVEKAPGDIPPCEEEDYDFGDYNDVDEYSIY